MEIKLYVSGDKISITRAGKVPLWPSSSHAIHDYMPTPPGGYYI
jgi:hypothetical protein